MRLGNIVDDFSVFTDKDRQDISYGACIGGMVLVGAAVGRLAMLPGLFAGAAAGLAIGLVTCKRLSPAIEQKIFSQNEKLSDFEVLHTLRVIRDETGIKTKADAMYLLSYLRSEVVPKGQAVNNGKLSCIPLRMAANQILSNRVS
jgi:hypothetical protein